LQKRSWLNGVARSNGFALSCNSPGPDNLPGKAIG
jgi:hypothetical protein